MRKNLLDVGGEEKMKAARIHEFGSPEVVAAGVRIANEHGLSTRGAAQFN